MKNFSILLPAAGTNVFIPKDGALREVRIARVVIHLGGVGYFDSEGNLLFNDTPDSPKAEVFSSYEDYKNGNPIRTVTKISEGCGDCLVYDKDGELCIEGYRVCGDVVFKIDEPLEYVILVPDGSFWRLNRGNLYSTREEAMWGHDTVEVKADGTKVRHEAGKKTWEFSEAQQAVVEELKAVLKKVTENKLRLALFDGHLSCFSYARFNMTSVEDESYISEDWAAVPDEAYEPVGELPGEEIGHGEVFAVK